MISVFLTDAGCAGMHCVRNGTSPHQNIGKRKNDLERSLMSIKDKYFSSTLTKHLKIGHSEGKEHFSSPLTKHLKIGHSEEKKTVTFILKNADETTSLSNWKARKREISHFSQLCCLCRKRKTLISTKSCASWQECTGSLVGTPCHGSSLGRRTSSAGKFSSQRRWERKWKTGGEHQTL